MTTFRRHAVYWAPPAGSGMARFGAAWLGWDPEAGRAVPHPEMPGLPVPVAEVTAGPRRYGLHGTLKAPFRLVDGANPAALEQALAGLAAETAPFEAPALALERIGRFVALVPSAGCPPLSALAGRIVAGLDGFRAPSPEGELVRRRAAGLTPRQEEYLVRWGYPYVLDEFRFHLTLTGALAPEMMPPVVDALTGLTEPFRAKPLPVTEICLFGEDAAGFFHVVGRYALTG